MKRAHRTPLHFLRSAACLLLTALLGLPLFTAALADSTGKAPQPLPDGLLPVLLDCTDRTLTMNASRFPAGVGQRQYAVVEEGKDFDPDTARWVSVEEGATQLVLGAEGTGISLYANALYRVYMRYGGTESYNPSNIASATFYTRRGVPSGNVVDPSGNVLGWKISYESEDITFPEAYIEVNVSENFDGRFVRSGTKLYADGGYYGMNLYMRFKATDELLAGVPSLWQVYAQPEAPTKFFGTVTYYADYAEVLPSNSVPNTEQISATGADDEWMSLNQLPYHYSDGLPMQPGDTLYFRLYGNDNTATAPSLPNSILFTRPAAPQNLQGHVDGTITGVDAAMQYRKAGGSWKTCTGDTITGLDAGDYEVRYLYTDASFASESAIVTIPVPDYTLAVSDVDIPTGGYGEDVGAFPLTIQNLGNLPSTVLDVTLGGTNADAFVLTKNDKQGADPTAPVVLPVGDTDSGSYSIKPKLGLYAGAYTAEVTLFYQGGSSKAAVTYTVRGDDQAAPPPPQVESNDSRGVTLKALAPNANGAAPQYSCDGGATWQDSPVFTNLASGTYTFAVRYGLFQGYLPSPISTLQVFHGSVNLPQTGDESLIALWALLSLSSAALLIALRRCRAAR